jgi:uncharacterized protein (TIGR03067 family)
MNSTLLVIVLGLGAPALKDPPKKEVNIVGEWVVESQTSGGAMVKSPTPQTYTFSADGTWTVTRGGKAIGKASRIYTLDKTTNPPSIDLKTNAAAARPSMTGIVKVEHDVLTLCYSRGGEDRPTKFESPEDSSIILIVLRRVKKE